MGFLRVCHVALNFGFPSVLVKLSFIALSLGQKRPVCLLVSARVIFDHARQRFFMTTADHLKEILRIFFPGQENLLKF
jgi:hypothetical protein